MVPNHWLVVFNATSHDQTQFCVYKALHLSQSKEKISELVITLEVEVINFEGYCSMNFIHDLGILIYLFKLFIIINKLHLLYFLYSKLIIKMYVKKAISIKIDMALLLLYSETNRDFRVMSPIRANFFSVINYVVLLHKLLCIFLGFTFCSRV
jgi:hypothetical protein